MPPVNTTIFDTFNRADSPTSLGTGWADAFGSLSMGVISNAAYAQQSAYCASYNTATLGPDFQIGLEVGALASGAFSSLRASIAMADITSNTWDGYQVLVYADHIAISKQENNADVELLSYSASLPVAGDVYLAERISNNWELWRLRSSTWTSLGTVSNSVFPGSGNIAVDAYDPGATGRIAALYGATLAGGTTYTKTGLGIVGP